jgi:hypothetical protein
VIPLTGLALPCVCACPKLIPVEYILPSLFKVLSCTKTTVGQMNQEPGNILTWCNLNRNHNPSLLITGSPKAIHIQTNDKKPAQILFHSKRPHINTKMNDNINMASTIAGSINVCS